MKCGGRPNSASKRSNCRSISALTLAGEMERNTYARRIQPSTESLRSAVAVRLKWSPIDKADRGRSRANRSANAPSTTQLVALIAPARDNATIDVHAASVRPKSSAQTTTFLARASAMLSALRAMRFYRLPRSRERTAIDFVGDHVARALFHFLENSADIFPNHAERNQLNPREEKNRRRKGCESGNRLIQE